MSTAGAPGGGDYLAVWTGTEMIVWSWWFGARYNPTSDTWAPVSTAGAPANGSSAVWTGSEMIVWGGTYPETSGGRYDPATDTWVPMATDGQPEQYRFGHAAVWIGEEMIIWGGRNGDYYKSGGIYTPATDTWRPVSEAGAPEARAYAAAAWTGAELLVWGGEGIENCPYECPMPYLDGGWYDPQTDTWTLSHAPGAPDVGDMAAYVLAGVWTGGQLVVFGADPTDCALAGGRFEEASGTWSPMSLTGAPATCGVQTGVWTGSQMIVMGGSDLAAGGEIWHGGLYDPAADTWEPMSFDGAPEFRVRSTAVWTGDEMIVWGGRLRVGGNPPEIYLNTGGRYTP